MQQYIGVDLGGTHIRVARSDHQGNILASNSYATFVYEGSFQAHLTDAILREVQAMPSGSIGGIGVGIPAIYHDGHINAAPNIPVFDAQAVIAEFEALRIPLRFRNDVGCAALGEMWLGAAKNCRDFLYVNLGTGISVASVLGGKLHLGHRSAAGEIAYWVTDPGSNVGYAAGHAPLEETFSGRWLAENLNATLHPDEPFTTKKVFEAYGAGDAQIRAAVDAALTHCTNALANCCILLDPELLIFGGGMVDALPMFLDAMQTYFAQVIPNPPRIARTTLEGKAGLYGALRLAMSPADDA